jgi:hypothetical protein
MPRVQTLPLVACAAIILVAACGGSGPVESPSAVASARADSSTSPGTSGDSWAADLTILDQKVRTIHPGPFVATPEAAWVAKLDELRKTLPTATPDQRIVQFASLVGLLDTHSGMGGHFHYYGALFYPFADGWFVVRAMDPSLVGLRLVSIGGHPVNDVEAALRPLVPADNESGELDGLQGAMSTVEFLHGLGIVEDPAKPDFVLQRNDGSQSTVELTSTEPVEFWESQLGIIGDLMGDAPEAVARRGQSAWTRLDKPTKTFILSYNDYSEEGLKQPLAAMKTALDDGSATRVIIDMRYIRGGNGSLAGPLIDAVAGDPRVNRPGGLAVLIGRENVSAGTIVAAALDTKTKAVLIGEMTPARADNFLCDCVDVELPNAGLTVTLPTQRAGTGDPRLAVEPDIPFALKAADFFAGRDPALELALKAGSTAP